MLKRNSKALAIVMAFVFCMSFLAPAFVAPDAAQASSTYTVLKTESVSSTGTTLTSVKVQIDVPSITSMSIYDMVTLHLPTGLVFGNYNAATNTNPVTFSVAAVAGTYLSATAAPSATAGDINVFAPTMSSDSSNNAFNAAGSFAAYAVGKNTLDIKVMQNVTGGTSTTGRLIVEFNNVKVTDSFDGDIKANFVAPTNSGFSSAMALTVAKYVSSSKGTTTLAKSITTMGAEKTTMDTIMIQESVKSALKANETIKLKLQNGFKWIAPAAAKIDAMWGYQGLMTFAAGTASTTTATVGTFWLSTDGQELYVKMPSTVAAASEGRLYMSNFQIDVADDNVAKKGDVIFSISSDDDNTTEQDVVIASYVDYEVTVEATSAPEVVAGWNETEVGTIRIKEGLAGALLPGRTVSLTVPTGVKWHIADTNAGLANYNTWPALDSAVPYSIESESGDITGIGGATITSTSNSGRTIKIAVPAHNDKSSILLKKLNVAISPDFVGDLNVEVAGTAGATGSVKVATVKAPVEFTSDGNAKIIIGLQAQSVGDITLKETIKEAIKADDKLNLGNNNSNGRRDIVMALPTGATWTTTPKVEVTEGDLTIDDVDTDGATLTIKFKSSSSKASTLKISDIKVTTDRTVPEGDFKVKVVGGTSTDTVIRSTALTDNANGDFFDTPTIKSIVVGQCVTPAPVDGTAGAAAGQFKIDSNIYTVNGVAKVMDAAPYIKDSRTYVPVKYLGLALGVAESDIVWDEATQKVTLTLGDNKVELTIGSTSYTVNGEAKTMDVAPEISNGRTMLPAKYVAEGLGYAVGWDASTRTVIVSK